MSLNPHPTRLWAMGAAAAALLTAGLPAPASDEPSVVSAASYRPTVAPDSIAAVFGVNLATASDSVPESPTLPTSLAGTTVKLREFGTNREIFAPLYAVSPTQVNFVVPGNVSWPVSAITITNSAGVQSVGNASVARLAPALFSCDASGHGPAAARILRNGVEPGEWTARFDEGQRKWIPIPVEFGTPPDTLYLLLYGTGIRNRGSLADVTVEVGDEKPPVLLAGPDPNAAGRDLVKVGPLPMSLAGGTRIIRVRVMTPFGIAVASNTVTVKFQ